MVPQGGRRTSIVTGLAFVAMLLGLLGMYAAMVDGTDRDAMTGPAMSAGSTVLPQYGPSAQIDSAGGSHDMGGMSDAGCLMFGVLCSLGVVALVMLGVLLRGPLARLRPMALPRSGLEDAASARSPRPPTPEFLSISRT